MKPSRLEGMSEAIKHTWHFIVEHVKKPLTLSQIRKSPRKNIHREAKCAVTVIRNNCTEVEHLMLVETASQFPCSQLI